MQVKHHTKDDVLVLTASRRGGGGGSLRDDFFIMFTIDGDEEDDEDITRVDIHYASRFLPLTAGRGYDADTDTLTLGEKPEPDAVYRVVDNGDFVSYRQWFDDGSEWDVVAIDLRHASEHLAPVIGALPQPLEVRMR